jgi:hypothetical protein
MGNGKVAADYAVRVKRGPSVSEPGPRTHDPKAIEAMDKFFGAQEEWQDYFKEIDRRDPNMRSGQR